MIDKYGYKGAITRDVLNYYCPMYRLQCQELRSEKDVRLALSYRRPVVARFYLTGPQWYNFGKFYHKNREGILTKADLKRYLSNRTDHGGHAVILIGIQPDCLVFMNSWGETFGDKGCFRVENMEVLNMVCYDVFWNENELKPEEKQAYEEYCRNSTQNMINKNVSNSMSQYQYKCPQCHYYATLEEYKGSIFLAKCPKCGETFRPNFKGFIDGLANHTQ